MSFAVGSDRAFLSTLMPLRSYYDKGAERKGSRAFLNERSIHKEAPLRTLSVLHASQNDERKFNIETSSSELKPGDLVSTCNDLDHLASFLVILSSLRTTYR